VKKTVKKAGAAEKKTEEKAEKAEKVYFSPRLFASPARADVSFFHHAILMLTDCPHRRPSPRQRPRRRKPLSPSDGRSPASSYRLCPKLSLPSKRLYSPSALARFSWLTASRFSGFGYCFSGQSVLFRVFLALREGWHVRRNKRLVCIYLSILETECHVLKIGLGSRSDFANAYATLKWADVDGASAVGRDGHRGCTTDAQLLVK
jgi:hypothetical protein